MRQASATHPRTITAVAIGNLCYTKTRLHIGAHPAKCRTAIKQRVKSSQHQRLTFSRPTRHPPIHASIDDSAPLLRAQLTRKRAPTPCHDTGLAGLGGSRQADPSLSLSNKGLLHCVHAFVLSKESAPPPTAHHAIVSRRPVANPPNRLHATGADRRTSLTSLCVSPSCGVPRDDASGHALVRGHREG